MALIAPITALIQTTGGEYAYEYRGIIRPKIKTENGLVMIIPSFDGDPLVVMDQSKVIILSIKGGIN